MDTPSAILLAAAGATLIITGLYFLVMRPPLLPEDVRYMNLGAAELATVRPRLEAWLGHVFWVMGGYVLATGVLMVTLAATSFRVHHWSAAVGVLIGGAASIGWMAVVKLPDQLRFQMGAVRDGRALGSQSVTVRVGESRWHRCRSSGGRLTRRCGRAG